MLRLPFELFLALRYLQPKRTFVSVITLISILGVALGVAVLIIVISVMSGFDHDLQQQILGFKPHIAVMKYNLAEQSGEPMKNYSNVAAVIARSRAVKSVAPFIFGPVLVRTEGPTNRPPLQDAPMLRGFDMDTEGRTSKLTNQIVEGEFNLAGHGMVVGVNFAETMHLSVGDHLAIFSQGELEKIFSAKAREANVQAMTDSYEIRGIYSTGYNEFDSRIVIVSIENAQELYGLDDAVHGLSVTLADPYRASEVKHLIERAFGVDYKVVTWMENDAAFLNALKVEKSMMFYLLFFIVLVAALCILSAQITFVIQKTREIGMLKALGASNFQISGIFLAQSAIIGVIGVAAGLGFGMLAVNYRNEFLHFMRSATGWELFPASVYGFGELPALVAPHDVAIICISSFIICILGGVLPAWRAGHLKPVEALRHE
jgi:lipoprotein-releasing system permease protein